MGTWTKMRLDQCTKIVSGATPSTSDEACWGGEICWATPKDLSDLGGRFISDTPRKLTTTGLNSCPATVLPAGSVLFSSRAPIGHVAINTLPMATNQGFKSFIPNPKLVDANFLYFWLRKNRPYLESLGNGATFKEVSKAVISRVEIELPTLPEQRRIAAILDQAEALRAKRRAALAKLDTLAQSLFIEMFGDPATNPKGWGKRPFGEICETRLGRMLDQKRETGVHSRPYLRNANVQWFSFDLLNVYEMDFAPEDRETYRLEVGDLLICEGGQPGRCAIWNGQIPECYFQKALHRARPRSGMATPEFLARQMWFLSQCGQLGDHVASATIAHLTGEKLKAMPIALPPLAIQQVYTERLKAFEGVANSQQNSIVHLDTLFASLQHRAFRGEL